MKSSASLGLTRKWQGSVDAFLFPCDASAEVVTTLQGEDTGFLAAVVLWTR